VTKRGRSTCHNKQGQHVTTSKDNMSQQARTICHNKQGQTQKG
jgi:hypothetical protein